MIDWCSIWQVLSQELLRLHKPSADSWHELANSRASAEAVEQDFALGDIPHRSEVENAIDAWTSYGTWPDLSDAARYCSS